MTNSSKDFNHFLLYKSDLIDLIGPFCSPIILGISSLSCFVVLRTYLKKLNKIMKGLLEALAIHNFISSLVCVLELIFMILLESQSFEACSILIQSWIPVLTISFDSLAVLSFMRYHIASKTAKTEVVDKSRKVLPTLIWIKSFDILIDFVKSLFKNVWMLICKVAGNNSVRQNYGGQNGAGHNAIRSK